MSKDLKNKGTRMKKENVSNKIWRNIKQVQYNLSTYFKWRITMMLINKTKRMRGIEEKENESISECIIVKDKEEETNMEGRRNKHWKKEKKYGMK